MNNPIDELIADLTESANNHGENGGMYTDGICRGLVIAIEEIESHRAALEAGCRGLMDKMTMTNAIEKLKSAVVEAVMKGSGPFDVNTFAQMGITQAVKDLIESHRAALEAGCRGTLARDFKNFIASVRYHERLIRGSRFPGNKETHCDALLLTCSNAEERLTAAFEETPDG